MITVGTLSEALVSAAENLCGSRLIFKFSQQPENFSLEAVIEL